MDDLARDGVITAAIASSEGRILARSILGTTDPRQIVGSINALCATRLGSEMGEAVFCEVSVGATFGLRLRDGCQVSLKVHSPGQTPGFLNAVDRIQRHLHRRGFPCPAPIAGPLPFGRGLATVEAFVDAGERADAHDPGIRRLMACALARMIALAAECPDVQGLSEGWTWPENELWPVPHNALFDFEASAEGAGWIDSIAAEAKKTIDTFTGRIVAGHADWSVKHFRFKDGEICVVYDWDSLRIDREAVIVGTAAATFPATWYVEVSSRAPSPDEMRNFIAEYESARDAPFSSREREATVAAATYVMAYSARCEHAVDLEGRDLRGSFREALSSYGEEYLRA